LEHGADCCVVCGTVIPGSTLSDDCAAATGFLDTIHLQTLSGESDDERIVRPSLAILFRMAVGPGADHYAPRFLEFERIGHGLPGWNWVSLWAPSAWAFYRKLWVAGVAFALWPLVAVAMFGAIQPYLGDSELTWLACAAILIWLVPGAVASLVADTLLYRNARRLVRKAEATTLWPEDAARMLATRTPVAPGSAVFLGGAAIMFALYVAAPSLQTAYADRLVRTRVAEVLAAIQPLQRQVEAWWGLSISAPVSPAYDVVGAQRGAEFLGDVDVNPANGRVRLALGPLIPELSGRSILMAPALDERQQFRWICIPIDIPMRYLPQECRQG
jgi:hypothetical protein